MKPSLEKLREAVRDRMRGYHARGGGLTWDIRNVHGSQDERYIGPPKELKNETKNETNDT